MEDVQEMKNKFYTERINCLQDFYIRPDLSQNSNGEQFVRWVHGFPYFLLIWSSNYQMNILKSVTKDDQMYIDGTFDICPEGCEQMVVLHIRKKGSNISVPIMFILLQRKDEMCYWWMWLVITQLVPELLTLDKMFMACDFEWAMHNALKAHFPNIEIIGCKFHLVKAIYRWINRKLSSDHIFKKQPKVKEEMKNELVDLSRLKCSKDEFMLKKESFAAKWRTIAGETFIKYMVKYYLGDGETKPTFRPEIWAMCMRSRWEGLDDTNNQAELLHHHLNERFTERPHLKRTVEILQEIESEFTSKDIQAKRKSLATVAVLTVKSQNNRIRARPFKIVDKNKGRSKRKKLDLDGRQESQESNIELSSSNNNSPAITSSQNQPEMLSSSNIRKLKFVEYVPNKTYSNPSVSNQYQVKNTAQQPYAHPNPQRPQIMFSSQHSYAFPQPQFLQPQFPQQQFQNNIGQSSMMYQTQNPYNDTNSSFIPYDKYTMK